MSLALTGFEEAQDVYVEACALAQQVNLHSTYKSWVSKQVSFNKSLESDLKGFRFRAPSEPYKGFASILKGYRTSDSGFARSKFGNLSSKNLEDYAKAIGVSMQAYVLATADSKDPFGDKASSLNEGINNMIEADCQKGRDAAESALKTLEKNIASRLS